MTPSSGAVSSAALAAKIKAAIIAHPSVTITAVDGAESGSVTMLVRFDANGVQTDSAMTVKAPGRPVMKVVSVRHVTYMSTGAKIAGKHWLRLPATGAMASAVGNLTGGGLIQSLNAAVKYANVTDRGASTVNGTAVTVYRLTLDAAAAKRMDAELGTTSSSDSTTTGSTVDLSVDASGLPLKLVATEAATAAGAKKTSVLTFSDWGQPVAVAAPTSSDTVDITKVSQDQLTKLFG